MQFGGLMAVDHVSFDVRQGEIFAIIGPNGAGKTTVFNCIGGFYRPTSGQLRLGGQNIAGQSSHRIANAGIVRTFQNVRLFKSMTVIENLLVAQHKKTQATVLAGLLNLPAYRRSEQKKIDHAMNWLDIVGLQHMANREAGNLAYGHQRRLEIARCMVTGPRLLMLDEPAAGLNPQEKINLARLIEDLRSAHKVSVLLIEHDMTLIMDISERILVMEYGKPIALGDPQAIRSDERVIQAYLGEA